jgi:pSer/pThr/pTyr-binding forkhead associated (FHA) protein
LFELSVFLRDRLIGRSVFADDEVRIGRSADNEVQIDNLALSRYHASIETAGGVHVIKDWQSQNGTYVNGEKIQGRRALNDGDRIGFGKFVLVFRSDKQGAAPDEDSKKVRDQASYAIAGETLVGAVAPEVRVRPCPHVGHLEFQASPNAAPVSIPLPRDVTVVGSSDKCEIVVPAGQSCPERAAAIVRGWLGFQLVAFGSGVKHRGEPLYSAATLSSGDELKFGNAVYRFHVTRLEVGP